MHAFMALNMLGGLVAAPLLGRALDRWAHPRRLLAVAAMLDAILLVALAAPLPTQLVLGLRILEGGAHIGAATMLMAEASALARTRGDGRTMGLAGGALMLAIALGSGLGGLLLGLDPRAPFWIAGAVSLAVAAVALSSRAASLAPPRAEPRDARSPFALLREQKSLLLPVTAAFVGRFTVGCLVVTFSLFAHRVHGLGDRAVGGMYTLLTFPFALAMYPIGRIAERISRASVLGLGAAVYGLTLAALGVLPTAALPVAMLLMGLSSAMIFAPTLCYASSFAGPGRRAGAMSLVNAASCLGMLLGPAAAGILSAIFAAHGDRVTGYRAVFLLAGGSALVWLAASASWLVAQRRREAGALDRNGRAVAEA
jgi:MFS family permease